MLQNLYWLYNERKEKLMVYRCDDGETLVEVGSGHHVRVSKDSGKTWQELKPEVSDSASGPNIFCRAHTPDNQKHLVGENPGSLWISNDSGATWLRRTVGPEGHRRHWVSVAVSADGTTISAMVVLTHASLAVLYVSHDWGLYWSRAMEFSTAAFQGQAWKNANELEA
jgi:photosystem II stability/assembly factor-like uncharacterized protein